MFSFIKAGVRFLLHYYPPPFELVNISAACADLVTVGPRSTEMTSWCEQGRVSYFHHSDPKTDSENALILIIHKEQGSMW